MMGLLDSVNGLLGAIGGAQGQQGQTDNPNPKAMLIQAALGLVASGGLDGLLSKLQQGGLGEAVNSWISNGPNQAVSGEQMKQALGGGLIEQLAQKANLPEGEAASHLSEMLPQIIDGITKNGQLPSATPSLGDLAGMLGGLLGGDKKA